MEYGKTIQDYINEYQLKELYEQMKILTEATGVNLSMLKNIMTSGVTEENLDDFNRFSDLRITSDNTKTKLFLEKVTGKVIASPFVMARWTKVLKDFILDIMIGLYFLIIAGGIVFGILYILPVVLFIVSYLFSKSSRPDYSKKKRVIQTLIYTVCLSAALYAIYVLLLDIQIRPGILFR